MKSLPKTDNSSSLKLKKRKAPRRLRKGLATHLKPLARPSRLQAVIASSLLVIVLAEAGMAFAWHNANSHIAKPVAYVVPTYNVANILAERPTSTLVVSQGMLKVLRPTLGTKRQVFVQNACPSVNDAVVKQLQHRSITVLVDLHNYPGQRQCTLGQIVQAYGRPNASTRLTGSVTAPRKVLLYFDNGPQQSGPIHPISPAKAPATVVPMTLATLPSPTCRGKTYLSIVAHEDDDLLFMNPDLLHELHGGGCLRTVYLTAGDDGFRSSYWLAREKGVEAAYDSMHGGGASLWIERYIAVNKHEYVKMASPRGNPNITLVFVNVPDGNVPGGGFKTTNYQSLAKLANGSIAMVNTVDGQSHYSKDDLTSLLAQIMQLYKPNEIQTQTPINAATSGTEHSDHMAAGQFATAANKLYAANVPLTYYTGYPIGQLDQNVTGQDQVDKTAAFNAYVPHDKQVCLNPADCAPTGPYAIWNMRQYTYRPGDALITGAPAPTPSAPTTPTPSSPSAPDASPST